MTTNDSREGPIKDPGTLARKPGTRGRPPGSKNKLPSAVDTILRMGVDPAEFAAHIIKHGAILNADGSETPVETADRIRMIDILMPYIHSKAAVKLESKSEHTERRISMIAIMSNPELAEAAEKLAFAQLEASQHPAAIEAEFEPLSDDD